MKRILAIASIAVRSAVRSRVVVVLLTLLLVAIIGLPLTIKGDGTLAGKVQILLTYTLAAVNIILSIATLWAGCAAVSSEVQEKQIHLIVTKPVRRFEVWLGKWLGLLALNAVLLAVSGGVIYGLLRWNVQPGKLTAEEQRQLREQILVALAETLPEPLEVEADALEILKQQQTQGLLPTNQPVEQVLLAIKDSLTRAAFTVPTGYMRTWTFHLPELPTSDRPLLVRYKFGSSEIAKGTIVDGIWLVGPADSAERTQVRVRNAADGEHTAEIPVAALKGSRDVTVEYANVNMVPVAVLFEPKDGLGLMVYKGTFEGNFVRSLLALFFQLAFLGALAVSAGTLLSLPVAALVTGYALVLVKAGDYMATLASEKGTFFGDPQAATSGTALDWLFRQVLRVESWIVQPLQGPSPLEYLADGRLIEWSTVAASLLIKVVIYSGIIAAVTAFLFNRREIALPQQ